MNINKLALTSGTNHSTSSSNSSSNSQTASLSSAGNVGANVSGSKANSNSQAVEQLNSTLNTGDIQGDLDVLSLKGGRINAQTGDLTVKDLDITTQQNTATSNNGSRDWSVGISGVSGGVSGGSLGITQSKGSSDSAISIEQSGIVFGSDQHQLTVDNTVNNGGIIAHIESNANGEAINKTLNFTTKTIKTTDIKDHATSEQRSLGVNVGINNAKDKGTSKNEQSLGTSSINASHSGHDYQATTQATIGEGAVVTTNPNALANINRDVNTATNITKNQDVGGLNANLTVDSRLFTEAGRAQIKAEQEDLGKNLVITGKITGAGVESSTAATVGLVTGDQTFEQAINTLLNPARAAQFVKDHPEMAAVLKAYQEKDYDGLVNAKVGLQVLADYLKVDVTVLLNSLGVKGVTNKEIISLDVGLANRKDTVEVLGHEVAHNQGMSSETMSNLVGSSVDLAFDAQTSVMDSIIVTYQASLNAEDPAKQKEANTELLSMGNTLLVNAMLAQPEKMEYWGSVGHQSTMAVGTYLGGLRPEIAKAVGVAAFASDADPRNAMSGKSLITAKDPKGNQQHIHLLDGETDPVKVKEKQAYFTQRLEFHLRKINDMTDPIKIAEYLKDHAVQNDLHSFGDSFAHVDGEGRHFEPRQGHLFPSLGSMWFGTKTDPDSPVEHPEAYKQMLQAIVQAATNATGKPRADGKEAAIIASTVSNTKGKNAEDTAKLHMELLQQKLADYYPILTVNPVTNQQVLMPPNVIEKKNLEDWDLLGKGKGAMPEYKSQVEDGINSALGIKKNDENMDTPK